MSINVTVRGNPISIKRGRMVTHDIESEFERRRKIRLQQVRQQSKEIAANIRNRVRREKENQLSKVEQRTEDELKRWKARKLAKLQKQLTESDRLRGDAQERAKNEIDNETVLKQINEKNHLEAIERGKIALEEKAKLQKEAMREAQRRHEIKKTTRKVEDARSALISKIHQESTNKIKPEQHSKKESKRSSSHSGGDKDKQDRSSNKNAKVKNKKIQKIDIDFSSPEPGRQSPSSSKSKSLSGNSSPSPPPSPKKSHPKTKTISIDYKKCQATQKIKYEDTTGKRKKANRTPSPTILTKTSFTLSSDDEDRAVYCYRSPSTSTSTSSSADFQQNEYRTKQPSRGDGKQKDYLDQSNDDSPAKICKAPCAEIATQTTRTVPALKKKKGKLPPKDKSPKKKDNKFEIKSHDVVVIPAELPYVPTTCIEQEIRMEQLPPQPKRVSCVDLDNKFVSTYEAAPLVAKISKLNLIRDEEDTEQKSMKDLQKQMTARDNKAQQRGVKALHRHKIQKDYQKLLEELPVLQRQERLAQMKTHDPKLHMPDDRIKQLEKRRQNKIENIFEKYYSRAKILETPTITIRPVQKPAPTDEMKLPFRALDVTESPVDLNVGCWERPPSFEPVFSPYKSPIKSSGQQAQHTINFCQEVKCQQQQDVLMDLLARVNRQRELLMQEVASLPTSKHKTLVSEGTGTSPPTTNKTLKKSRRSTKTVATSPKKPSESRSSSKTKLSVGSNTSMEIKYKKSKKKSKRKEEETQTSPSIKKLDVNMMFVTDKTTNTTQEKEEQKPIRCQHCPPVLICSCPPELRTGKKEDCTCSTNDVKEDKKSKEKKSLDKSSDKVCEIVIKTKDNAHVQVSKHDHSPKVVLNVTKREGKSSTKSHPSTKSSVSTVFQPLPNYSDKTHSGINPDSTTYKHMLYNKPQQTNVDKETQSHSEPEKKICPNLLKYVKKLLSMSRKNIDELTVSSISEVSTPGNSIINSSTNVTPLIQLQTIMQKYNLSLSDIQKQLSPSSSDVSIKHKHQPELSTTTSTESDQKMKQPPRVKRKSPPKKETAKTQTDSGSPKKSSKSTKTWSPKSHEEVLEMVEETYGLSQHDMQEIPNILSRYKDLTQTCCDRICKLTKLIDNVRLEKERILSPASDKSGGKNECSETSSMSQSEVDRYLLAVDKPASPIRVKSPTPKNPQSPKSPQRPTKITSPQKSISPSRYEEKPSSAPAPSFATVCVPDGDSKQPSIDDDEGIPKFHDTERDKTTIVIKSPTKYTVCPKTRPPPSLRNTRLDLHVTPHELSTINELDTMIISRSISEIIIRTPKGDRHHRQSSDEPFMQIKLQDESSKSSSPSPKGKKTSKAGSPPKKDHPRTKSPDKVHLSKSDSKPGSRPTTAKTKPRSPKRNRPSTPSPKRALKQKIQKEILVKSSSSSPASSPVISGVLPLTDKSTSSSADDMAAILEKMGMGWAVATLKKTQEQYVLSTSSSSSATSFKKLSKDSSSPTDARPDMEICGCDYTMLGGKDASTQRDSDLSSVRMNSDEFLFLSIPNLSLDTNKTLNRSD